MSFCDRLESFRPAGYTDSAFAKFLGIPLMTFRGLKLGAEPSEKTIQKIAKATKSTPAEVRYGLVKRRLAL